MKRILYCILTPALFCAACKNASDTHTGSTHSDSARIVELNEEVLPSCYVLCDFSASLGGDSRRLIIENARRILLSLVQEYRVRYYDINAPQFTPAFFEYAAPGRAVMKPSERRERNTRTGKAADSLRVLMQQRYKSPYPLTTCIIRTLDKIANAMAVDMAAKEGKVTRVVILSDMLEACGYSFGNINIEKPPYTSAKRALAKMPRPIFNFAPFRGLEVTTIAVSNQVIANTDTVYSFWKEVFARYGYDFKGPITANLPSWITVN